MLTLLKIKLFLDLKTPYALLTILLNILFSVFKLGTFFVSQTLPNTKIDVYKEL